MTLPEHEPPPGLARKRAALAIFAGLGLVAAFFRPGPSEPTSAGVAEMLGRAAGKVVDPREFRWEPSRGALVDAFFGRRVLFLGASAAGAPRDVLRARVRVTLEGRPLDVRDVRNLTSTDLGDDHALVVRGDRAAYATYAFGHEQSVTYLDLSGEGAKNITVKLHDRAMAAVTNAQQTGSLEGIGRVDVTLEQPARAVGLALDDTGLAVSLADDAGTRSFHVLAATGELDHEVEAVHAQASQHLPKRLVFWAVDTVRAVPEIGPAPIAWLEERAFFLRDQGRKLSYKVGGEGGELAQVAPEPPKLLSAESAGEGAADFPPQNIPSIWKNPQEGEGVWVAPSQPWLKRFPSFGQAGEPAPTMFYRTFVRPDEERAYAKVLLVAMDMRQLDLGMEGGMEDPKPAVGPPGAGRIPRDPEIFTKVAVSFNGGFKTEHGSYGMMVRKRVLLPPQPGAASVVLLKDGRVGMGSWGNTTKVTGLVDIADSDILSFRQNLDPLLDGDKVNPSGRSLWGFTLPGTSMQTERSGICVTPAGHLYYAWGDDVSATTLGKAMKMAGCTYGMHLDMNPHHTGLVFTNITEIKGKQYKTELLSNQMEISPDRFIDFSPKDFFYLTVHDPTPPKLAADVTAKAWAPDVGVQPAPAWSPGLWSTSTSSGVEVLYASSGRALYHVRAGKNEVGAGATELSEDDKKRVVFALTLGNSSEKHPLGLVTDGKVVRAPSASAEHAVVVISPTGGVTLVPASEAKPGEKDDAVELPLLVAEGKALAKSARAGLGVAPDGSLVVARSAAASRAVADALVAAGCKVAVALDRGAGDPVFLHRTGTPTPPHVTYDATTLYAMAKPLVPKGFRFQPVSPVPPPTKK
ncbi:MAG: hypothetical protein U0183_15430 [Polyangiaceae bacterium]